MEIKNRLFPYPVLCDESDDYDQETLIVRSKTQERIHDIHIHVEFELEDTAMLDLIRMGHAEYILHLECSTTSFRKVIKSDVSIIDFNIPKSRVNVEIAVLAMVVAKRKIRNFTSDKLNEDYIGEEINFDKGSILAYKNLPRIYVYKNYEELAGNESLFTVVKVGLPDDTEIKPVQFNLSGPRIQILVDAKTYESYIHFQQKSAIAMSMLVLPALIYMIDELREDAEGYSGKMWFMKMKQFYKVQGLDFIEDIVHGRNAVEAAQEMLKYPIARAYRELMEAEEEE